MSKLTALEVQTIRTASYVLSRKHLARQYKVSLQTIGNILRRKSWKHLS